MRTWILLCVLLLGIGPATRGMAHLQSGAQVRSFFLTGTPATTEVFLRAPMPLVFTEIERRLSAGNPDPGTPFFYSETRRDGTLGYRVSLKAIAAGSRDFTARMAGALIWQSDGRQVPARVRLYRIDPRRPDAPAGSAAQARSALAEPTGRFDPDFSTAWIEMAVSLSARPGRGALSVRSATPALDLAKDVSIENHVTDARRSENAVGFVVPGQLQRPMLIDRSPLALPGLYLRIGLGLIPKRPDLVALALLLGFGTLSRRRFITRTAASLAGLVAGLGAGLFAAMPAGASWSCAPGLVFALGVAATAALMLIRRRVHAGAYAVLGAMFGVGAVLALPPLPRDGVAGTALAWAGLSGGIAAGVLILAVVAALSARLLSGRTAHWPKLQAIVVAGLCLIAALYALAQAVALI